MESKAWNIIVNTNKQHFFSPETGNKLPTVQNDWEQFLGELSVFGGYSKLFGEIDSQRHLQIGHSIVIPDIVIKDSSTQKDLFVIELKRYCIPWEQESENQLISYIRQLSLHVGLFVCQDLYLYYVNGKGVIKTKIPFIIDNQDGSTVVKLLKKGSFDEDNVKQFITEKNVQEEHIRQIRQELQTLTSEKLFEKYFSDRYAVDEIHQALKDMSIEIGVKVKQEQSQRIINAVESPTGKMFIPTTADVYDEPDFKYVIIKIHEDTVRQRGSVYESVRHAWKVSLQRISNYHYVFAVINGVVKGVFVVDKWQYDTHGRSPRVEFIGSHALDKENLFINKKIPAKYRVKGQASPVLFSKN